MEIRQILGDAGPHRVTGRRGFAAPEGGMATLQVRHEPSNNVSVKGRVTVCCDELCVGNSVKGFQLFNCQCHCAGVRARFVICFNTL